MAKPNITPENGGQPESVVLPPPHGAQLPLACHVTLLGKVAVRTDRLPLSEPPELDQPDPLKSSIVLIVPAGQSGTCSIPAMSIQRDGTGVSDGDWQTAFGRVGMVIGFQGVSEKFPKCPRFRICRSGFVPMKNPRAHAARLSLCLLSTYYSLLSAVLRRAATSGVGSFLKPSVFSFASSNRS